METKRKVLLSLIFLFHIFLNSSTAQWVHVTNGMGNQVIYSLAANGNNIFAGAYYYGVYLSTNNGSSWSHSPFPNDRNVYSLAFSGSNIFAGTGSSYGVYKSSDNGSSWTQTSLNNQSVYSLAVNGNYIFAGTNANGIYLSTNNGTNWVQTSLNNLVVFSLAVNGNYIYAGDGDGFGVHLSTNNGTSWSQTSLNNRVVFSLAVNTNTIFAGTYNYGIYSSTNNGTNWTQTSLNSQWVRSLAVTGINVFAGAYQNGVYVSNDNGMTWIQRNEGLNGVALIDASCIVNNFIFIGTDSSVYRRPLGELVGIKPISEELPTQYALEQNYPNPFNPSTKIKFAITKPSFTSIKIYDILGREVSVLVNEQLKPGTYEAEWDASNYPSGVFYYRLIANDFTETKKMILLR